MSEKEPVKADRWDLEEFTIKIEMWRDWVKNSRF